MSDDHTEINRDVRGSGRVTITEAATLLGVHPNTVRSRVKAGVYKAEKVTTEHGLTWMIDRDSLVNNPLPRESQHGPTQVVNNEGVAPIEVVQELLRPFVEDLGRVREELGAERVLREQAEERVARLESELEALRETRESASAAFQATVTSNASLKDSVSPASESRVSSTLRNRWSGGLLTSLRASPPLRKQIFGGWILPLWILSMLGPGAVSSIWFSGSLLVPITSCDTNCYRFAPTWLLLGFLFPIVFGLVNGAKPRPQILRGIRMLNSFAWIAGLGAGGVSIALLQILSLSLNDLNEFSFWEWLITIVVVFIPVYLFIFFASLIGRAFQRRKTHAQVHGTPEGENISAKAGERWTPKQQALAGLAGTIITALFTLLGVVLQVFYGSGT